MERVTQVTDVGCGAEELNIAPPITVQWSTLVEGIGITFSGIAKMLSALDPHMTTTVYEMVRAEQERRTHQEPTSKMRPVRTNDSSAEEGLCTELGVYYEDLIKVIVSKIKQNNANKQRIGSILKSYRVEKVSELRPDQYEAFLTDLAQL